MSAPGSAPILTVRQRNRTLLERQLLAERSAMSIEDALDHVGGLQTQYAPSGYVGLWTRLAAFRREDLTAALEARTVVQATLMRSTIHLVAGRTFWRYAVGVRRARREWAARVSNLPRDDELRRRSDALRARLAAGPADVRELGDDGRGFIGNLGLWVDIVRVPPSGTWERRRADRLALAEHWVGPEDVDEPAARRYLVEAYLRAFGPAAWRDIAGWAGLPVTDTRAAGAGLDLVGYRAEDGTELVDLGGLEIAEPDRPVPVRFLPHWDATLLVHARGTGILPEAHRSRIFSSKNPFSVGTVLVDGHVAATWGFRDGRIRVELFEDVAPAVARAIEDERAALEAFHA